MRTVVLLHDFTEDGCDTLLQPPVLFRGVDHLSGQEVPSFTRHKLHGVPPLIDLLQSFTHQCLIENTLQALVIC